MKLTQLIAIFMGLHLLCSCTMFYAKQSDPAPLVQSPKPLAVPVGKNWQVIEEAPQLSDGSRLPFQTEQSLHPEAARPVPADNRTIETTR
ncbi:MAG: hypothetical protein GJV46_03670 [Geobacter sp.]|nr:hypothetical protein [Geobacter sp.]